MIVSCVRCNWYSLFKMKNLNHLINSCSEQNWTQQREKVEALEKYLFCCSFCLVSKSGRKREGERERALCLSGSISDLNFHSHFHFQLSPLSSSRLLFSKRRGERVAHSFNTSSSWSSFSNNITETLCKGYTNRS